MTQAPVGWSEVTLGCLTRSDSPICYGVLKPGDPDPEGVPMVRVTDIRTNEFKSSRVIYITPELDAEFSRSRVVPGDVLISVQGTVGRVAIVPTSFPDGNISRTIARIRPIDPRLSRWIQGALLAPEQQTKIDSETGGTTRDSLNIGDLREITIPLAPANEQYRIVARIDSLSAKSKRAREHLDHVPRLVKKYKQAFLDAAFRGDLTAKWRATRGGLHPGVVEVREIAEVVTGATPPSALKAEYFGGTIAFFKPTDLDAGYHVTSPRETLTETGARRLRLVPSGSTLVTCIGATIGKTGFARVECCTNQQINALIPDLDRVLPEWLYWGTVSPSFQRAVLENASATTLPIINKGRFQRLSFSLPTLEEQVELVRLIESAFAWIDRLAAEATSACKLIDHLDQAVLSKAFRGELVPQDPDDEPASVLLERIKAERAGETPARRGRGRPRLTTAT